MRALRSFKGVLRRAEVVVGEEGGGRGACCLGGEPVEMLLPTTVAY